MSPEEPSHDLASWVRRLETERRWTRLALAVLALAVVAISSFGRQPRPTKALGVVRAGKFVLESHGKAVGEWSVGSTNRGELRMWSDSGKASVGITTTQIGLRYAHDHFNVLPRSMVFGGEGDPNTPPLALERGPDGVMYLYDGKGGAARPSGPLPHPVVFDSLRKVWPHGPTR